MPDVNDRTGSIGHFEVGGEEDPRGGVGWEVEWGQTALEGFLFFE